MYFDEANEVQHLVASQDMKLVLSVNGLVIFLLGLLPGTLMSACVIATISYSS